MHGLMKKGGIPGMTGSVQSNGWWNRHNRRERRLTVTEPSARTIAQSLGFIFGQTFHVRREAFRLTIPVMAT